MIDEFRMPLQEALQGITAKNEQAAIAEGFDVGTPRLAHQERHLAENVSGSEPHRSSLEIDLYRTGGDEIDRVAPFAAADEIGRAHV